MPLVRSQGDEFRHIESDLDVTSIERWRVSTSHPQRSSDLRYSLKPGSRNPRFSSKPTSWTTAAHRVVRLEKVQEEEECDDHSACHPELPKVPIETNDQIDGAHSMILNSPTHDLANPFPFAFEDSENILYQCRRDPRNIVLDSAQPEMAPHIVITPPVFNWTDFSTMLDNAAPLQQHPEYLCVPGSALTALFASVPTEEEDGEVQAKISIVDSEEPKSVSPPDDSASVDGTQPMRVFSHSLFTRMITAASEERKIIPHLLGSLYKRLFLTCATFASDVARGFRTRHSSSTAISELFSHLETPITWSDPASPLLSCFHRFPGALVIDSVTPFTVPHIVITEPPIWDYNPYVNMHNDTQTPQDAGWGQYLVVPNLLVDFINLPEDVPPEFDELTSGCSLIAHHAESESECDMWEPESPSDGSVVGSPASTTLQTPGLLTPIDEEEEFDLMVFDSSSPQTSPLSAAEGDDPPLDNTPQNAGIFCDDEDDDLPPLDGWYQDIAARSGYVFST